MPRDPLDERILLTRDDRALLAGEADDVADPDRRRRELRTNARRRLRGLRRELALLRESGEADFADEVVDELATIVVEQGDGEVQSRFRFD
jgi:hypothetical protein